MIIAVAILRVVVPYMILLSTFIGLFGSVLYRPDMNAIEYAICLEGGALFFKNMWASNGYNFDVFREDNFSEDVTQKGLFFRLRNKFDEEGIKRIPLVTSLFDN